MRPRRPTWKENLALENPDISIINTHTDIYVSAPYKGNTRHQSLSQI